MLYVLIVPPSLTDSLTSGLACPRRYLRRIIVDWLTGSSQGSVELFRKYIVLIQRITVVGCSR